MPRKRSPSHREPTCKTKAHIILYLANQKEASFREIREYLIDTLNIRNTKGTKIHLTELEDMGLIAKTPFKRGIKDSFFLDSRFSTMKGLYNYLVKCEYELSIPIKEFMKTPYYEQRMQDEELLPKIMINLNKENLVRFIRLVLSDNIKEIVDDYLPDSEDKDELIKILDDQQESENIRQLKSILDVIEYKSVDDLFTIAKRVMSDIERMYQGEKVDININDLAILILSINILQGEDKKQIRNILRYSPSAFNFVINSTSPNSIYLSLTLGKSIQTISQLFYLSLEKSIENSKKTNKAEIDTSEYKYPYEIIEPLIMILKSMVIYDLTNDKLVTRDIPLDLHNYVFSRPLMEASK